MQVFEDGAPVGGGLSVNLGTRLTSHTYHVRITAPGFVTSYTLTAND